MPTTWKQPPRAKVFEALSAIADDRVKALGDNTVEVTSSDGTKSYRVTWSDDMRQISSNDNASYWQGYAGYPIIAALLLKGKLAFTPSVARSLSSIPWKKLNTKYRRDYEAVISNVLDGIEKAGGDRNLIVQEVERILVALEQLKLERLPSKEKPPQDSRG